MLKSNQPGQSGGPLRFRLNRPRWLTRRPGGPDPETPLSWFASPRVYPDTVSVTVGDPYTIGGLGLNDGSAGVANCRRLTFFGIGTAVAFIATGAGGSRSLSGVLCELADAAHDVSLALVTGLLPFADRRLLGEVAGGARNRFECVIIGLAAQWASEFGPVAIPDCPAVGGLATKWEFDDGVAARSAYFGIDMTRPGSYAR